MNRRWLWPGTIQGAIFWLTLAAIVAFGIILVSFSLDRSLALDEPFSANVIRLEWTRMYEKVWRFETPLYHTGLKAWTTAFGESEIALRSFSVFCFALTIITIGYTARQLGGARAGVAAALLVSTSYLGLQHAGTARMYALLGLQIALTTSLIFQIEAVPGQKMREASPVRWILLATLLTVTNLSGLLNHSTYLFFLGASSVGSLFLSRRTFAVVTCCSLLALVLHLGIFAPDLMGLLQARVTNWMRAPRLGDLAVGLLRLWGPRLTLLMVLYLLVVVVMHWKAAAAVLRSPEVLALAAMLLLLALVPFAASYVRPVFYEMRTPALALPAACLLLGLLLPRLGSARHLAMVMAVLCVGSLWTCLVAPPVEPGGGPARSSVYYVAGRAECGDTVISDEYAYDEIGYYLRRAGAEGCLEHWAFPRSMPPELVETIDLPSRSPCQPGEAEQYVDCLLDTTSPVTVWLFHQSQPGHQDGLGLLKRQLDARLVPVESLPLRGSFFDAVTLYSSPSTAILGVRP
jgi:hypothetical protein